MSWADTLADIQKQDLLREIKKKPSAGIFNFCSNDYLGLSQDPRVIQGAIEATQKYGAGSGAARLIAGTSDLTAELEEKLVVWKGVEACLLFNSGTHANVGVIPALAGEGDMIFSDELNHASIIDGCRLSKAKTVVYRHNDLGHLEDLLKRIPLLAKEGLGEVLNRDPTQPPLCKGRRLLIITESVFSMEGDLSPLDDLKSLAEKYGALLYIDEAHAVGVFGENGEGRVGKNPPEYMITMGTLGKAFGSYGAFVSGSKLLREFLINKARSFIFSTFLPPSVLGASLASLKIISTEPELRKKLWENIDYVGANLGFALGRSQGSPLRDKSPIFSIRIGEAKKTMEISEKLLKEGIYIQGIRPPTVPEGTSRLRLTMSAQHTVKEISLLVKKLEKLL